MPILTTPSEILVFSSDFESHGATDKNTAVAAIPSHLFIVTSRAIESMPFALAILRIASNDKVGGHGQSKLARVRNGPNGLAYADFRFA
jgi:hypothetical protein